MHKLTLTRETVRNLSESESRDVNGGAYTYTCQVNTTYCSNVLCKTDLCAHSRYC